MGNLVDTAPKVNVLYYGTYKQGKTTAMAGLARLGKIVAIDMEGYGWLGKPLADRGIPTENIVEVFKPRTWKEIEKVYYQVLGMLNDDIDIIGVCIDHMTEMESILLREAANDRLDKVRRNVKGNEHKPEVQGVLEALDEFETDIRDYGKWTNQAKKVTRWFRDLPVHVAFGAHFRTEKGTRVPDLSEKYRNVLAGSVNMVCATHTMQVGDGDVAYVGTFREMNGWAGGDRFGVTRPITVNPSFDKLVLAAEGKLDLATTDDQVMFKQLMSQVKKK